MSDNCLSKNCDCEKVEPRPDNCSKLYELNDLKIRPAMRKISMSEWCNVQEAIRQAFYAVWCVFTNIINFVCYILKAVDCLERKVDSLCSTAKCQNAQLTEILGLLKGTTIENIAISMKQVMSSGRVKLVDINKDGSFKLKWDKYANGTSQGEGTITGKVHYTTSLEKNGDIKTHIDKVTFSNMSYVGKKGRFINEAIISISKLDGEKVFEKSYDPALAWSGEVREIIINKDVKYSASAGVKNIELFKFFDSWVDIETTNTISIGFFTSTQGCVIDCDNC